MLRIRIPPGFIEIAEEAEDGGTFDASLATILKLLQKAAREGNTRQTHLLTLSLHAFLHFKGGHYALPTVRAAQGRLQDASEPAAPAAGGRGADQPLDRQ